MYHVGVTTFSLGLWEMCSVWYPTSYKKTLIWPRLFGEIILIILFQKLNFNTRLVTCAYSKTAVNPLTHGTYHMRPFTTKCSLLHSRFESLSLFHLSCGGDYSQHVFFFPTSICFCFFLAILFVWRVWHARQDNVVFDIDMGVLVPLLFFSRTTFFFLFSNHFFFLSRSGFIFLVPLFVLSLTIFSSSRTTFFLLAILLSCLACHINQHGFYL